MKVSGMISAIVIGAVFGFLPGGPAWSDDKGKGEGKATDMVKEAKITIDQAVKTATEKVQGTVVEAELEKRHGKTVWEVEVVGGDGKVTEVHIDAGSGDVIDAEAKKERKKHKK
jgi:uncharacterized membrane protein YkoI